MRQGSPNPGGGQAEGMRQLLSQGTRCSALLERLVRIAQMPQNKGCIGEANDPPPYAAVEEHLGVVTLSVIQCQALLQVRPGRSELTQREEGAAQSPICLDE